MTALVTPDAVEAAARADWERYWNHKPWADLAPDARENVRVSIRLTLAAAAPLIAQQALLDAAEAITAKTPHERRSQDFCAGMENAAHIVRARAATLTPKERWPMNTIDTNTQIDAIKISEDQGTWIVRGTTDIDTASAHVVRLIVNKAGSDAEAVGAEVIALVEASKTAQTSDLWYFLDDSVPDPVLRLMDARDERVAGCSQEFFVGVLFGAHVQASQ